MKKTLFSVLLIASTMTTFGQNAHNKRNKAQLLSHLQSTKKQIHGLLQEINADSIELKNEFNIAYSLMYDVFYEAYNTRRSKQLLTAQIERYFHHIYNQTKSNDELIEDFFDLEEDKTQREVVLSIFAKHYKKYRRRYPKIFKEADIGLVELFCGLLLTVDTAHIIERTILLNGLLKKADAKIKELEK